ncbi:MAG: sugar transferase [Candidatus Marinimicrobia bacterium]|nr:sugar transferase [Candidatus Neomarinimicrobiota bacterium]MCF7830362.1 sugar transferase [Candidatus Neomarinimicrobiota bacterium]MCF7882458.1 sugar transferase [Candidatus Neomarinimicrobiota bacterium]
MSKGWRRFFLLFGDILALNIAAAITFHYRFISGAFNNPVQLYWSDVPLPFLVLTLTWLGLFAINGLYAIQSTVSRTDEVLTIWKATLLGVLLLFLITVDPANPMSEGRTALVVYGLLIAGLISVNHFIIHTVHRKLLAMGKGHQPTLIVGWNPLGHDYYHRITNHPALGLNVVGFITLSPEKYNDEGIDGITVLGGLKDLPDVISIHGIQQIVIALESSDHRHLLDVIEITSGLPVSLKIIPDMYDIISGQARTNQIYGVPLIDIMPELMPLWEHVVKRLIDIGISSLVLILFSPLWLIIAIAIKLDSRGPVIYRQRRLGKNGKVFKIMKFRSMVQDAERETGPVWASPDDPRVTRVGKILRKSRLDEIPQFINVLKGEMSLIGPRPERPEMAAEIEKEIPLHPRRLRVRPGITGWAQVKHKYDTTLEDVEKKLEYDLFYIENMSLRLDMKILLNTFWVVLSGKGH